MSTLIRKHTKVEIDAPIGEHRIVHHRGTRKYFRLGVREADFLATLDGSRDAESLRAEPPGGFSAEQVAFLIQWLGVQGLLAGTEAAAPPTFAQRLLALLDPSRWQFTLANPDRLLDRHLNWVHGFFSRPALLGYLIVVLLPAGLYALSPRMLDQAPSLLAPGFTTAQWLALYAAILFMVAVHELAHAITCKHYGGEVPKIGFKLICLQPVVFCDVSSVWRFRDRSQKVAVMAAGIFVQVLFSSLALAGWAVLGWPTLWYFAVLNAAIALSNLYPFMKFDGYWLLVHLLDQPEMMQRAHAAVDAALLRLLGGKHVGFSSPYLAYGLACRASALIVWGAGVLSIYYYLSTQSVAGGFALVALIGAQALWKTVQGALALRRQYVRSGTA